MRKLFSLFLALVATTSLWAQTFQVGDLYYKITSSSAPYTVEVRGVVSSITSTIIIPETVIYNSTTYSVTSIGGWAFRGCSRLTSVTIPNSVTSIEISAFNGCSSLTSVIIPNSVTSIGGWAFSGCSSLTSPVYNAHCFAYLPTSFEGTYTVPDGIKLIAGGAFSGCSSLTSITIPNSVTSIEISAFNGCSSLTSVTIGNSVTSIGWGAFEYCSSLTSIAIPNSVTSIGEWAFAYCSSLTLITIPNSVTTVGGGMFSGCSKLKSVVLSNNITSLPSYYDGSGSTYGFFEYCSSLTSVTIGNSVTSIGNDAFSDCSSLTSITIPNSVTSIGGAAFRGCSRLTSVTIPNSVTSIGGWSFAYCSSLTSITIPNSVTRIGELAFSYCSFLTSITIPESVTSIGDWAFRGCSSLTSPVYNAHCFAYLPTSFEGTYTVPDGIKQIAGGAFEYCSSLTSVTIPESVTSIGNYTFYDCSSLTSVTIPESVTSIGDGAFYDCSSLISVTCEATTPPTLGSHVFYGVSTSIPVYVPCGSENIYKAAYDWKEFTNIQEPLAEYSIQVSTSNSQIGTALVDYNTFCDGAKISATANDYYHFVQWSDGNTDNPRTLTLTQDTVLTAEFALTIAGQCGDNLYWSYDETAKTISITGSGKMYDYTASTQPWLLFKEEIKEVIIANTATSIGTSAFEGCIRLGKVSIGTAMVNIGANAFAGCTRLYDIYVYATYPPFADESSFANYNVYLYVPCENQRDYILDIVWGKFKFIECIGAESEEVPTDSVVVSPGSTDVTITWPTEEGADTYTIVIKKDGEVFCTITFNAEGQLLNIAFAPGRDGNHPAQYAEAVANGKGFRFTVTGLEDGTDYTYDITVKDASNQTINSHTGAFTTQSTTAVDDITTTTANIQKIMRNGQLIIRRDGVEYNAMGQEIQ